jgi:hypothetical protein
MWDQLILCYQLLDKKQAAQELVLQRLQVRRGYWRMMKGEEPTTRRFLYWFTAQHQQQSELYSTVALASCTST